MYLEQGGFKESTAADVPPPLSAVEDTLKMLGNEWKALQRDLSVLFKHKTSALIVIFSVGAVVGVLVAFGLFAAMGGLSPQVVYVQAPAANQAPSGSGSGSGEANGDKPVKPKSD